jgi:hypothetical protein
MPSGYCTLQSLEGGDMGATIKRIKAFISGNRLVLDQIKEKHFCQGLLSFDSIIPMPPSLNIEEGSSRVMTGYNALHGDWRLESDLWMLKAPARELGFSFPLGSREEVLSCIRALDNPEFYLVPGEAYHQNMSVHGFASARPWKRKNWGTDWISDNGVIHDSGGEIFLDFHAAHYPDKLFKRLSKDSPEASIWIVFADQYKDVAKSLILQRGKETTVHEFPHAKIRSLVFSQEVTSSKAFIDAVDK